ncbi:MAG: OadG family protein [Anaerolineae bacterium]|nr:OadG family protein [Anaerolineae bacterium]
MSPVLSQALWLTVIGMGMTFLSIGALVGGIYLLTHLTRAKEMAPVEPASESSRSGTEAVFSAPADWDAAEAEPRRRAVAAAVAVAMALEVDGRAVAATGAEIRPTSPWNAYVRGLHLSSRTRYESRRPSQ